MRLLPLKEAKVAVKARETALKAKEERLILSIAEKTRELSLIRETSETSLHSFSNEMEERIGKLHAEVRLLEEQRAAFLVSPPAKELERRERSFNERKAKWESKLQDQKREIRDAFKRLETSEEALAVGWDALDERKANLTRREMASETKERELIGLERRFNETIHTIDAELTSRACEVERREKVCAFWYEELGVRETELDAKERDLLADAATMQAERSHMESQMQSLRSAFEEARKRAII